MYASRVKGQLIRVVVRAIWITAAYVSALVFRLVHGSSHSASDMLIAAVPVIVLVFASLEPALLG